MLDELLAANVIAPIDFAFARHLAAKANASTKEIVAFSAALVSAERNAGHACIALEHFAGQPFSKERIDAPTFDFPDVTQWRAALKDSGLVGDGSLVTPLVLDAGNRLYLYRYWHAEQAIAQGVRARILSSRSAAPPTADVVDLFRLLFRNQGEGTQLEAQAIAVASALRHRLVVVTGGPGTGKTTTVVRLLALLLSNNADLRVALAAPTGKAAARMSESINGQLAALEHAGVSEQVLLAIPKTARTLHRLLGYRPVSESFSFNHSRFLPFDTIILDESSMVDALMMEALFRASTAQTQIVLLGDKDQLTSVEAGYVLGDICAAAQLERPVSTSFADDLLKLSGKSVSSESNGVPLRDAVVALQRSYRFRDDEGIGALSRAIRAGDDANFIDVLKNKNSSRGEAQVSLQAHPRDSRALFACWKEQITAWQNAQTAEDALRILNEIKILCATRRGPWGVHSLNSMFERCIDLRRTNTRSPFYQGQPIIVTQNDYSVGLFNGDMGICWADGGQMYAWFADADKGTRRIPVGKLPAHETAWAITVHKSQGSEFDEVLVVMPPEDAEFLVREWLYTAVTRAREKVRIVATEAVARAVVSRKTKRASGLTDALIAMTKE